MKSLEKNIKLIFAGFSVLFIILILYLTYFTIFERERLIQSSYNRRLWEQEDKILRGSIYDFKGRPLADSVKEGESKRRLYPGGKAFGPLLGYSNRQLGRAGLENILNSHLLGISEKDPSQILRQKILGVSDRGNDIYLTIDMDLQKRAYEMLAGRPGALVAMDPKTGEILALVSSPGYDPQNLIKEWENIKDHPDKPLINRATQGLYPPGSCFKIVTLSAALSHNPEIENKIYYTPGYAKVNGSIIKDYEGLWPGEFDLTNAFRYSSNSVFVQIALEVGKENLLSTAEAFGFNQKTKTQIPIAQSSFPKPPLIGGNVELAEDSIGQGKVLVTPFKMAQVTSIIANGGMMAYPYILKKSVSPLGQVKSLDPQMTPKKVLDITVANKVRDLMVDVVKNGTGKAAAIQGIEVAGKTGSAENPHGKAHAWFVGFAPAQNPKIAVAVVVENAGAGGQNAGPIAREIMLQYINSH